PAGCPANTGRPIIRAFPDERSRTAEEEAIMTRSVDPQPHRLLGVLSLALVAMLAACSPAGAPPGSTSPPAQPPAASPAAPPPPPAPSRAPARPASPAQPAPAAAAQPDPAASPAAAAPAGKRGGTLRIALQGEWKTLDPPLYTNVTERQIFYAIYNPLVAMD